MRIDQFPASTLHMFRNPATWVAIAVYGIAWAGARVVLVPPGVVPEGMEFVMPFLFVAAQVALAPLPWLWTGDDRPQAPPLRGLLQAIPWNALWIGAGIGLLVLLSSGRGVGEHETKLRALGYQPPFRPEWMLFVVNFTLAMILGLFLAEKERVESSERALKRLADQTRGQVLQAQLNPHVLFNVLGGLTELVHEDPDAAESALVALIQMYRELTVHGVALAAPLRDERRILEHYLDIEEIRLGKRLDVAWEWPGWADPLELPPLLLQPLVENAVKHGISPLPEGGAIRIVVERKPGRLALSVANNGVPLDVRAPDGTGIGNLRERLRLIPDLDARLDLLVEEGWTVARVNLAWRWNP
jgi:signal transduction histidine kinase